MLADDNGAIRTLLRVLLELEPEFDVVGEAATGSEALEAVERFRPEVLVLDLAMPDFDGLEVLERLGASAGATRVVVYSGHATGQIEQAARSLGARDFIVKGTEPAEVIRRLRAVAA